MLLEKRTCFWDNIHNFYAIFLLSLHCGHDLQVLLLQKCKCFAWYTNKPDLYQTTLETDIQKLIDFINTSECVILVIEKVTPHPNDNFIDKCARTSTLRDAINFEAAKQAKLQVKGIRIENYRC